MLALPLLVSRVRADHVDAALAFNYFAVLADPLDARSDFHDRPSREGAKRLSISLWTDSPQVLFTSAFGNSDRWDEPEGELNVPG